MVGICYREPKDGNQLIINVFDGHNYSAHYGRYSNSCYRYNYKSYSAYPYHFLNEHDVERCRYLLQQLCNSEHIIFRLQSSIVGKFLCCYSMSYININQKCKE